MKRLTIKQYLDDEGRYYIENKQKEKLGDIYFYDDWKKWVFESEMGIVFTWDCLKEVSEFVKVFAESKLKQKG